MKNKYKIKRLQHKLMIAFLMLSITPLTLLAFFFLESHSTDLKNQSMAHLEFLKESKKEKLTDYFNNLQSEVKSFSRSELASASGGRFYGLIAAFRQLGATEEQARKELRNTFTTNNTYIAKSNEYYTNHERYRLLHNRYDRGFKEHLKRSDFSDILLVDIKGNVAYSSSKDEYFGGNLLDEISQDTPASKIFRQISKMTNSPLIDEKNIQILFSDFETDKDNQLAAWFAAPIIQQEYLHSFVLFKLPHTALAELLTDVSHDIGTITTTLAAKKESPIDIASNSLLPFNHFAISSAFAGENTVGSFLNVLEIPVLGAYTPLQVLDTTWALILELPENQAYQKIYELEKVFIVVMLMAILFVIFASHYLSNSITAPLKNLTKITEKVANGDLNQEIKCTERNDEIGSLAKSFSRMQTSIREKMALISKQNIELEQSINLIQKKNDALEQADIIKDEFLATTSHELRTPLHGMIGIAESLLAGAEGMPSPRQKHQLEILINSGQRLSNLVNDLLDYHKMCNGDLKICPQAVDTADVVRLVIELSGHLIGKKSIRVINQVPIDLPLARADEQRLEQVLYNLIGNAIKYTDEGKIIVSSNKLDNAIRIQIVDTGQGIPNDQLHQIFEPLNQVKTDKNQYIKGAGLGLSISRQLIEIMGGQLYVSSQSMVGTTFSFTLPFATEEDIANTKLAQQVHFSVPKIEHDITPTPPTITDPNAPLVLIVDDEPVNLQVLSNFLSLEGYRVKSVENGRQAIETVTLEKPTLLLLDVMMPGLSGYEVCSHLREHFTKAELPIILLSALGQVQEKIKGFNAGANDYLTKPFNKEELQSRISAYIHASQTEIIENKNQSLLKDIEHQHLINRQRIEIQERLIHRLGFYHEAIIGTDAKGNIRYINDACANLFGLTKETVIEQALKTVSAEAARIKQSDFNKPIQINTFIGNKKQHLTLEVLTLSHDDSLQRLYLFSTGKKTPSNYVEKLEEAVDALSEIAFNGNVEKLNTLKSLGGKFSEIPQNYKKHEINPQQNLRETLVKTMNCALSYWQDTTGKTKFDLAEESGLWRVYLDRSTLQTRTFDKYLHKESVPKSPRWKTVISTVEYILENSPAETLQREELMTLFDHLKSQLSTK